MEISAHSSGWRPAVWAGLTGLQIGMLAGVAVLAFHIFDGVLRGAGPWAYANLLSSAFYPARMLSVSFRWATLSGIALHLFASGVLGVLFTLLLRPAWRRPLRYRLLAIILSLGWYYASFRYLWPAVNPAVVIHQPFPGMLLGHVLFGVCVGLSPRLPLDLG
jgi:hypothetical protein